jgi:GH35 family endo-1,4-beta-xylanase
MDTGSEREEELLAGADRRIESLRKADAVLAVRDRSGAPVRGAEAVFSQKSHSFLFGCNIFQLFRGTEARNAAYAERFRKFLNFATLPFYWGQYESEKGQKLSQKETNLRTARWCAEQSILTKGHPLIWHEVFPKWGPTDAASARRLSEERVREIVPEFAGLVGMWDVVNEATVAGRFDNGIGRWIGADPEAAVADALAWARESDPKAFLLYNDFNLSPEYEVLASALAGRKGLVDAFGIQSHMHQGEWPLEKAWDVCETYSRFGLPLHFTELTVLSGPHKDPDDKDWHTVRPDWNTTAEGETFQARYVERLYLLLFSHPAVKAITWWDLADGGWQGAPCGLVRKDLSPKPAYERLESLVNSRWKSNAALDSDASGAVRFRGFLGDYQVTVRGKAYEFTLRPGENRWEIAV